MHTDDIDDSIGRARQGFAFSGVFERIGFVESGLVANRRSPNSMSDIPIWDVYVPLRCDLKVSFAVEDGRVSALELTLPSGRAAVKWSATEAAEAIPAANPRFAELMVEALQRKLDGEEVPGLVMSPRRLVSPPIWADGLKEDACELHAFSGVNAFNKVVLLGSPGSGKSTVGRTLAAAHLSPLLEPRREETPESQGIWADEARTPIYVECKDFVASDYFPRVGDMPSTDTLIRYIKDDYLPDDQAVADLVTDDLIAGRAILILDGMDEIPIPTKVQDGIGLRRDQMRALLRSVGARFPGTQIVVTSRPAAYADWELEGFEVLRLQPMDRAETRHLVLNLLSVVGSSDANAEDQSSHLLAQLDRIPAALREQPLFVTLLAFLFLDSDEELPTQRGALLEGAVQLLLSTWTEKRTGARSIEERVGCTQSELYERLTAIAFRMHLAEKENSEAEADERTVPVGEILEELYKLGAHVDIRAALSYLSDQSGLLSSPAPLKFRFAHRLFEEYLTAVYLTTIDGGMEDLARRLRANPSQWIEIAQLAGDVLRNNGRRHEQWELLSEVLEYADAEDRWDTGVWTAAQIIRDQGLAREESRLVRLVVERFSNLAVQVLGTRGECGPRERVEIAEALADFDDPRAGVGVGVDGVPSIEWVAVSAGNAVIGSDPGDMNKLLEIVDSETWDIRRESPKHVVAVDAFEMAKYPVTVSQYQAFVLAEDGFYNDRWWDERSLEWRNAYGPARIPDGAEVNWPQTYVTWFEAIAFAEWLGSRIGGTVSVPNEVQWEYGARGTDGRLFPWGNELIADATNWSHVSIGRVVPVGCFDQTPGAWGFAGPSDMVGNVWEWCSNVVQFPDGEVAAYPYNNGDGRESIDMPITAMRATRGGYFGDLALVARSSYRGRDVPDSRFVRQGFRVIRTFGQDHLAI